MYPFQSIVCFFTGVAALILGLIFGGFVAVAAYLASRDGLFGHVDPIEVAVPVILVIAGLLLVRLAVQLGR